MVCKSQCWFWIRKGKKDRENNAKLKREGWIWGHGHVRKEEISAEQEHGVLIPHNPKAKFTKKLKH